MPSSLPLLKVYKAFTEHVTVLLYFVHQKAHNSQCLGMPVLQNSQCFIFASELRLDACA